MMMMRCTQGNQFQGRVALVGTHLPRQCGIASFTADLRAALSRVLPPGNVAVMPITDVVEGYDYPTDVWFEIAERERNSYERAGEFLNINDFEVISLQHEFGIFGGAAGAHVLTLLRTLRMPVAATLHTVLRDPESTQRAVMERLIERCDRLVVMTTLGAEFLHDVYGADPDRIDVIPHGIPDMPFVDPSFYKDKFRAGGQNMLLTFGLLGPGKGIEHVIRAMPAIVREHPDTVYMVVGATHPSLRRHEGEAYRNRLQKLVKDLRMEGHVLFHNRYITPLELNEYLSAADIYIAPYPRLEQICSGTLAYALGAGKAVVATRFWHARELLADERGILVDPESESIAAAVIGLLSNPAARDAMRKRAYLYTRHMTWPNVASRYLKCFERMLLDRQMRVRAVTEPLLPGAALELPTIELEHLRRLTDDTGLLQHAVGSIPNCAEGYSLDDNARALILMMRLEQLNGGPMRDLLPRYAAFVQYAFNAKNRRFRNFMTYGRAWMEEAGSEDSHGRALWALGTTVSHSTHVPLREWAGQLFEAALLPAAEFTSPRAWAFTLLGLDEYLKRFAGDRIAADVRAAVAQRLVNLYETTHDSEWRWFEEHMTYCNGRLPQALIVTGQALRDASMLNTGLESLIWLCHFQIAEEGWFMPVGCNGFASRGGSRARFDQQPIEANCALGACLAAHAVTGEERWQREAQRAFDWFLGRNDLGVPVFDALTGGCCDAIHPDRLNRNQGAESTLAYLLSLTAMHAVEGGVAPSVGDDATDDAFGLPDDRTVLQEH